MPKKPDRLKVNKYLLPYDVYERHRKVGSYIQNTQTVLDVGGELNHLSHFCRPKKIVVANLKSGDVIISGNQLSFAKNSFDVVTSIDVLEHIPKPKRTKFIRDLLKVASQKVILSFPIGTKKHIRYEKEMYDYLIKNKQNVEYLSEHILYGLPTNEEIQKITKNFKKEIYYSGNIFINKILFLIFMFSPPLKLVGKILYFTKKLFNLFTNPLFYFVLMNKPYSQMVNRAYLVIEKRGKIQKKQNN